MYSRFLKPLIDIVESLLGLVILSPVFLIISVSLILPTRATFILSIKAGENGKIFRIVKLITMNEKRGPDGNLLSDAERLTPLGRFVRKASLDEILNSSMF
jgi:lipopolysaccharide/colanic/teichoic acid biosynthesis glycosyltransferase